MEQIMEQIKGQIAKIEPLKKPYTPPPPSGGLMGSMYNLSRARDLVDDVQRNQVILNKFYQRIIISGRN